MPIFIDKIPTCRRIYRQRVKIVSPLFTKKKIRTNPRYNGKYDLLEIKKKGGFNNQYCCYSRLMYPLQR